MNCMNSLCSGLIANKPTTYSSDANIEYTMNYVINNGTVITNIGSFGSTNNGTSSNASSSSTQTRPGSTYSLYQNNSTQGYLSGGPYVLINNGITLQSTKGLTLCWWIWLPQTAQSPYLLDIASSAAAGANNMLVHYVNQSSWTTTGSATTTMILYPHYPLTSYMNTSYSASTGSVPCGAWAHCAITAVATTGLINMYVNAVSKASSTFSQIYMTPSRPSCILASTWFNNPPGTYYMQDFRYYEKCLSQSEIQTIYNNT